MPRCQVPLAARGSAAVGESVSRARRGGRARPSSSAEEEGDAGGKCQEADQERDSQGKRADQRLQANDDQVDRQQDGAKTASSQGHSYSSFPPHTFLSPWAHPGPVGATRHATRHAVWLPPCPKALRRPPPSSTSPAGWRWSPAPRPASAKPSRGPSPPPAPGSCLPAASAPTSKPPPSAFAKPAARRWRCPATPVAPPRCTRWPTRCAAPSAASTCWATTPPPAPTSDRCWRPTKGNGTRPSRPTSRATRCAPAPPAPCCV